MQGTKVEYTRYIRLNVAFHELVLTLASLCTKGQVFHAVCEQGGNL